MTAQPSWITSKGANSAVVTYPAGGTLADLIDTVESYITAHGWTLYDASAGANARVYRATSYDGSYGYLHLNYNSSGYLRIGLYESWNSVTHTGTNLQIDSGSTTWAQIVNLTTGGEMYVFTTSAWCIFHSYVGGVVGNSAGVGNCFTGVIEVEVTRSPSSIPNYMWLAADMDSVTGSPYRYGYPRTGSGLTGANAGFYGALVTDWGFLTVDYNFSATATTAHRRISSVIPSANAYGDIPVSTISHGFCFTPQSNNEITGRLYGLHMLQRYSSGALVPCATGNDCTIKMDDRYLMTPNGVNTDCWILGPAVGRFAIPK